MSVGLVRFVESGELVENTLDDATVLAAFRRDGAARLDRVAPRSAEMSTCSAAATEGMACGGLTAATDPNDALVCGVAIAATVVECQLAPTRFATATPPPQRDAQGGGAGGGGGGGGDDGYDGGGNDGRGYDGELRVRAR